MDELEKILDLENEIIANLLEEVLIDRDIPHVIRSYHDSAYDGLFTMQRGWGILEAPPKYRDEIISIHNTLNDQQVKD